MAELVARTRQGHNQLLGFLWQPQVHQPQYNGQHAKKNHPGQGQTPGEGELADPVLRTFNDGVKITPGPNQQEQHSKRDR